MDAVGRANRAKSKPVASAWYINPTSASMVTTMLAAESVRTDLAVADRGERLHAEEERPAESSAEHRRRQGRAVRPARRARYATAKRRLKPGRSAPTTPRNPLHDIVSR